MKKTYKKTIVKNRLEISFDDYPTSPRILMSNLGYFITCEKEYCSPDRQNDLINIVKNTGEIAMSQKEHIELIKKEIKENLNEKVIAIYPITKYEHGGVVYKLGSFNGFDYSQCGFYIITDKTQKELGGLKKNFEKVVRVELETYNSYVNGEMFRYVLFDQNGKVKDSCCGFYDIESIREYLPDEFKNDNLQNYFIN